MALVLQGLFAPTINAAEPLRISVPIITTGAALGSTAQFGITGASVGSTYVVETSTDLKAWSPAASLSEVSLPNFEKTVFLGARQAQFFRIVQYWPQVMVSSDSSTPGYQIAAAGSTNVTAGVFNLRLPAGGARVLRFPLKLTSGSPRSLIAVKLWNGTVQVGEAIFVGGSTNALATLIEGVGTAGNFLRITAKVDLSTQGPADPGIPGDFVTVDYDDSPPAGFEPRAVSLATGQNLNFTGQTHSSVVRVFRSFPVIKQIPLPATGMDDGQLIAWSVTANSTGPVGLGKVSIALDGFGVSDVNVIVYAYTDPSFSQPVSGVGSDGALVPTQLVSMVGTNHRAEVYPQSVSGIRTPLEIPAGTTRYFLARGGFGNKANASITATLLTEEGDRNIGTFSQIDTPLRGFFIWSPNSLTTTSHADSDWVNSYGLQGLFPNGFSQTRIP